MSKKNDIIAEVKKVISAYTQKLTLRQIYYRLVAKLVIQNNLNQYKYLSSVLVEARKTKQINYNVMEDRTRNITNKAQIRYSTWKENLEMLLDEIRDPSYYLPAALYQQEIILIALEKQALEGVFAEALKHTYNAILVVCRGYNSLTQIWDLSEILKNENRQVHCRFFSDFDPSGLDIQRNFEQQCKDLGIKFESFERVALIKEQIDKYKLPFAPTKISDSRSKGWNEAGVVELDALDPNILDAMIKQQCMQHWDPDIETAKKHLEIVLNKRYKKRLSKELIELANKLENGEA